jgi:hypothetical protein
MDLRPVISIINAKIFGRGNALFEVYGLEVTIHNKWKAI